MTKLSWVADERLYAADLTGAFSAVVAPKGARITNTGTQQVFTSGAAVAAFTFDTEQRDDETFHSIASNTTRIVVPTGAAGWYVFGGNVEWGSSATGTRNLQLRLNGTTLLASSVITPGVTGAYGQTVSTARYLAVADYIELMGSQNSGGNMTVSQISDYTPIFWAVAMRGH